MNKLFFALRLSFWMVFLITLVVCGTVVPAVIPTPTETSIPTATFVSPTPTSLIPAATLTPPWPTPLPVMTPDAIQVERWREYQTELAKLVLSEAGDIFPYYELALCEWDLLGRSGQEVYVWARCLAPNIGDRKPAVIHLGEDGSVQKVEVPFHGSTWNSALQKLFPTDVQAKIETYFSSNSERAEELRKHLQYRLTHPDEPPLVVLLAMPTATPTP